MKRKAFTLIELLTVMAITAVMLTLIVLPLFQSFQLTRTAQAFADAQDKGRGLIAQISREVGNAVSVRSASSTIARLPGIDQATRKPLGGGAVDDNVLPYTKLDLVPPAQGTPNPNLPVGTFQDPISGKIDPTLTRPKGDINLNVVPGQTIVRYWVGLNRPFDPNTGNVASYNEPYTGLLVARNGDRDNLFVLRRFEVQSFVYRLDKNGTANSRKWRPNLDYFRSDDATDTRIIDLDDEYFFVPDGKYLPEGVADTYGNRLDDPQKNTRVANWAKGVIQTDVSRYDMIRPVLVGSPPQVDTNSLVTERVVPLIQFKPTRVASEPAAGSAAARPGEAVEGIDRIGPDTYKTGRGLWANAFVRYYPGSYVPGSTGANGLMEVANVDPLGTSIIESGSANVSGLDAGDNTTLFNLNTYERTLALGAGYPFTAATNGALLQSDDNRRNLFAPFRVLTAPGKIVTSFPIDQVGGANNPALAAGVPNLPFVNVTYAYTPASDPKTEAQYGVISPYTGNGAGQSANYDVNVAFNYLWNTYPELQGSLQRFIDLRMVANADGTLSPLCSLPSTATNQITGFSFQNPTTLGMDNHARIVPGSDEVYGPDQSPTNTRVDANGNPLPAPTVRYTRVTGNPGPNQYRLVYADLAEPTNGTTSQVDYSVLGLSPALTNAGGNFNATAYNYQNPVSVAIQARYKAGYLQLESDPNLPIPVGRITVRYRFQFTGPTDTFAVDLDTREVMQILLTVKNYPQSSAPNAQTVTLKATATLRNALR